MSNKSSHHESHQDADTQDGDARPRRLHHSPIFWLALVLALAGILAYVFTMDLATRPAPGPKQPAANTVP